MEKYLGRSISFTELFDDDLTQPLNARGVDPRDNIRPLISSKAKFVGRALMLWGSEQNLGTYLTRAKPYIETLHQMDPDLILQAAAFEIVTTNVETIAIPPEVFTQFGQPVVARNFVYQNIVYANGNQVNHWGTNASVPDMNRLETRMWFYDRPLATSTRASRRSTSARSASWTRTIRDTSVGSTCWDAFGPMPSCTRAGTW